jgi:hypothetical protein
MTAFITAVQAHKIFLPEQHKNLIAKAEEAISDVYQGGKEIFGFSSPDDTAPMNPKADVPIEPEIASIPTSTWSKIKSITLEDVTNFLSIVGSIISLYLNVIQIKDLWKEKDKIQKYF